MRSAVVFALTFSLAAPAFAQTAPATTPATTPSTTVPAENAESLLQASIKAFDVAQFENARTLLGRAQTLASDAKLRAQIFLYLGLTHAVLGATAAAKKAFAAALTHDATLTLDERKFKTALVQLFNSVRAQLTGELSVNVREPRATVYVDGVKRGTVPYVAQLSVGSHAIEVRSVDGKRVLTKQQVVVTPYRRVEVVAALPAAKLTIASMPSGAEVSVDGSVVGSAPVTLAVASGLHEITVRQAGFAPKTRQVRLQAGKDTSVQLRLERAERGMSTRGQRLWTWIAAGGAVVGLGVGLALQVSSNADYGDWERGCRDRGDPVCESLQGRIEDKDLAAGVLFGVGAALATTAVVLYFLEGRSAGSERAAKQKARKVVLPLLGPGYGGALVRF